MHVELAGVARAPHVDFDDLVVDERERRRAGVIPRGGGNGRRGELAAGSVEPPEHVAGAVRGRELAADREVVEARVRVAEFPGAEVVERRDAAERVREGLALARDQRVGQVVDRTRIGESPGLDRGADLRPREPRDQLGAPEVVEPVGERDRRSRRAPSASAPGRRRRPRTAPRRRAASVRARGPMVAARAPA